MDPVRPYTRRAFQEETSTVKWTREQEEQEDQQKRPGHDSLVIQMPHKPYGHKFEAMCARKRSLQRKCFFLQIFLIPTSRRRKSLCKIISKSAEPTTTPYCVQNKLTCFKKIQGTTQLIRLSRRPDQEDVHLLLHNKKFFEGLKG